MKTLVQLVPNVNSRDGIGRVALAIHRLAEELGFRSWIVTEKQESFGFGNWRLGPLRRGALDGLSIRPDVLIYQHSIGSPTADTFLKTKAEKKILLYQNITPAGLFLDDKSQEDSRWGRRQLQSLIEESDYQAGMSEYTCRELREAGAHNVVILPYFLNEEIPFKIRIPRKPLVLMVGRVVRFKRILEGIKAFKKFRERFRDAELVIVGRGDEIYLKELRQYISENDLSGSVHLKGRVAEWRLRRFYQKASVFLTLSAHEGFCIPLVEAMQYQLPIVAYRAGAIPHTLGKGGILLDSFDPTSVAKALTRVMNTEVRVQLMHAQRKELRRFRCGVFANALRDLVSIS